MLRSKRERQLSLRLLGKWPCKWHDGGSVGQWVVPCTDSQGVRAGIPTTGVASKIVPGLSRLQ